MLHNMRLNVLLINYISIINTHYYFNLKLKSFIL